MESLLLESRFPWQLPRGFFKVKDEGSTVIEGVGYSGIEEKIKEAAESCPVEVIKYEEA